MAKRPRMKHGSTFKANVALEAIKGEQAIVKLAESFQCTRIRLLSERSN